MTITGVHKNRIAALQVTNSESADRNSNVKESEFDPTAISAAGYNLMIKERCHLRELGRQMRPAGAANRCRTTAAGLCSVQSVYVAAPFLHMMALPSRLNAVEDSSCDVYSSPPQAE